MLKVITGPFHPDLELALVAEIQAFKSADPLTPLTIVVPSDPLRRRLKRLLCLEHQFALFDVHFLTFHQLAIRLLQEAGVDDLSRVRPDFFYRELVHQLLLKPAPSHGDDGKGSAQWSDLAEMPGAWGALLATLHDLKNAKVDPECALDAISQGENSSCEDLGPLMRLYRAFLDEKIGMGVIDRDDLASSAEIYAITSAFLHRQKRILYYGFYDVTQVQLDLFQTIVRHYPTTLFFPMVKGHPAYGFAERFFERHLLGLAGQELQSPQRTTLSGQAHDDGLVRSGQPCRILSVSGPLDELTVVAKDILGLVEERGYAFEEIGVVARTLTGYETLLPRIFDQHAIPFKSTMARPVSEFPLAKACLQLLDLRVSGFRRDRVIELLSSPFLRLSSVCPSHVTPRHDVWDVATRRLGITKGMDEWTRLTKYLERDLPLRDDGDGELVGPRISCRHIQNLWAAVSALASSLQSVPDSGTWEEYSEHVQKLCDEWLDARGGGPDGQANVTDQLMECVTQALVELRWLSAITREVTLVDFTAAFHRLMEETLVPMASSQSGGVQVFDAMAARGASFRALYIVGLNEKVFPRHIREDAFLRDRTRRFLEVDLGFKIQEKLAGYDEEKLLFTLLCRSAKEQLTLLYQRTDEAGRSLLPSAYLADVQRAVGTGEQVVPRRLTTKFESTPQYHPDRLTPSELATKFLLMRRVPRGLLKEGYEAGHVVARALPALSSLDGAEQRLGAYDGITGPLESAWQMMQLSGASPTALQEYATCPFRYFAKQVLRLRPLTVPESIDQIGPAELGALAHNILRRCLQALTAQGYFSHETTSIDPMDVLGQAAREEFARFADSHPVGYLLVWRLHQERLLTLLRDALREDLAEMARKGWEPVLFEEEMVGKLNVPLSGMPVEPTEILIAGRLDRVDWSPSQNAYRIIDYKFKTSRHPDTLDKNLPMGATRATRLQPPLYLTMADALRTRMPGGSTETTCRGVWFYYLAPAWHTSLRQASFPGDAWNSSITPSILQAITHVLSGIRSGRFFIYASGSCDRCDYRLLCRKSHQPTVWRARLDHALVGPYRALRSAPSPKGDTSSGTGLSE
ncbi:PD-(D/E)XK nuclease family protein [Nitrospira sp. Nam74]